MPTYVYKCPDCEHEFETVQSMKDKPLTKCPECKKKNLFKVLQPAGGFRIYGRGVTRPTSRMG